MYHEKDDSFNVGVGISRSEKYIYIETGAHLQKPESMLLLAYGMTSWG